jgi:hypothetical protein
VGGGVTDVLRRKGERKREKKVHEGTTGGVLQKNTRFLLFSCAHVVMHAFLSNCRGSNFRRGGQV